MLTGVATEGACSQLWMHRELAARGVACACRVHESAHSSDHECHACCHRRACDGARFDPEGRCRGGLVPRVACQVEAWPAHGMEKV